MKRAVELYPGIVSNPDILGGKPIWTQGWKIDAKGWNHAVITWRIRTQGVYLS